MPEILPVVEIVCLLVVIGFQIALFLRENGVDLSPVREMADGVEKNYERAERAVRDEIAKNRDETSNAARQSRAETAATLKNFNESLVTTIGEMAKLEKSQLDVFSDRLDKLTLANEQKLDKMRETV